MREFGNDAAKRIIVEAHPVRLSVEDQQRIGDDFDTLPDDWWLDDPKLLLAAQAHFELD
jgi:hypothetical protein